MQPRRVIGTIPAHFDIRVFTRNIEEAVSTLLTTIELDCSVEVVTTILVVFMPYNQALHAIEGKEEREQAMLVETLPHLTVRQEERGCTEPRRLSRAQPWYEVRRFLGGFVMVFWAR